MAKIKSKQESQRIRLETVIPLETPLLLQLAISSVCNFRCRYCPCSRPDLLKIRNVQKGIMDFDLYKKIIDDFDGFPQRLNIIRLVKEGEPLLNKHFVDMVRYAKKRQPLVKVDTTTNAFLLTPELSDAIIDAGLDKIFISLQGINAKSYRVLAGIDIDFDSLLKNIYYFCRNHKKCKVYIKVPDIGVSVSERQAFFRMFDDYADEMFVEHIFPTWPDFDISKVKKDDGLGAYGKPIVTEYIKVCAFPFYNFNINYDGSAAPCPLDWAHKAVLGDTARQSLYEVWNGENFNNLRRVHLRGERPSHPLCGKCDALKYCECDNIDTYASELLERFVGIP